MSNHQDSGGDPARRSPGDLHQPKPTVQSQVWSVHHAAAPVDSQRLAALLSRRPADLEAEVFEFAAKTATALMVRL
ncbi:MAG: hypothetical protein HS126_21680 [Anaerolineales bacterium]|nr:hypothetical protein [Anaerolineales bacterium]